MIRRAQWKQTRELVLSCMTHCCRSYLSHTGACYSMCGAYLALQRVAVIRNGNNLVLGNTAKLLYTQNGVIRKIQGVYKGMVQFQKLTRNLFLTLHGQNVHRQQRQLSQFLMC